jgi:8-oxo-dGTP diphosphatase
VVAGAIFVKRKVLVGQRIPGGSAGRQCEFPGGKVEPGETPRQALTREIFEELNLSVSPAEWLGRSEAVVSTGMIDLDLFAIRLDAAPASLSSADHLELHWATTGELPDFNWAEADRSLIAAVISALKNESE